MEYLVDRNNNNLSKKVYSETDKNNDNGSFSYKQNDSDKEFIVKNEDTIEYNYK